MTSAADNTYIEQLVEQLISSGSLGRSPVYGKLLSYLAVQTMNGTACSEYSIAVDVFDKPDNYDVAADSTVRVYIYNLRKKLEIYYADLGKNKPHQLDIPKGEYRLVIKSVKNNHNDDQQDISSDSEPHADMHAGITNQTNTQAIGLRLPHVLGLVALSVIATAFITALLIKQPVQEPAFSEQQLQFWGGILTDAKPIMVVVGDYFIFAESKAGEYADELRLVREFDINSADDLRRINSAFQNSDNQTPVKRFDLGLTYLPRGSAYALAKVQQLLQRTNKTPRISMMSELSAEDIRANHIIYIGYLSGLGVLEGYVFANSRFEVGNSYDVIIDTETNTPYRSDFIEAQEDRNFIDFGTISSFSLAANNQIIALTGTRDAGLMEMSDIAITPNLLDQIQLTSGNNQAYEALFEVNGFNLTNISSRLVISGNMYQDAVIEQ